MGPLGVDKTWDPPTPQNPGGPSRSWRSFLGTQDPVEGVSDAILRCGERVGRGAEGWIPSACSRSPWPKAKAKYYFVVAVPAAAAVAFESSVCKAELQVFKGLFWLD